MAPEATTSEDKPPGLPAEDQAASGYLKDRLPKLEPRRRRHNPENPLPRPETPVLPPPVAARKDSSTARKFQKPTRRILSKQDHERFLAGDTCKLVQAWVFRLAEAVVDKPRSALLKGGKEGDLSITVKRILSILDETLELVQQAPPDEQEGSRFGNKAFRDFLDLVDGRVRDWHRKLLTDAHYSDAAADEASTYLAQSFGNRTRIDYGSGHELNFVIWLLCLYQLGLLVPDDFCPLVLRVFDRYLDVARAAQAAYYLEPAGSHGVWGLDDYQFLPFLFGAAQLLHHPYLTPRAVRQDLAMEELGEDYMYLGQVAYVNSTKTVRGLRWHSPMLDDISAARNWAKVEAGMRRMFVAEVLGKLPVMQHFLFGSLVPAADGMSSEDVIIASEQEEEERGGTHGHGHPHDHDHNSWDDPCGIKVPSAVAAAEEQKKKGVQTLRRIPFD